MSVAPYNGIVSMHISSFLAVEGLKYRSTVQSKLVIFKAANMQMTVVSWLLYSTNLGPSPVAPFLILLTVVSNRIALQT
jgi:hypothetical protein